jgi:hypothetical protein
MKMLALAPHQSLECADMHEAELDLSQPFST